MKTTVVFREQIKKFTLFALCLILLISMIFSPFGKNNAVACSSSADCQATISALQDQIAKYQEITTSLNQQAISLQNTIARLENEQAVVQIQIDQNQAKYNDLSIQIIATEAKIKNNQDALGKTIADMYVDGEITPLEMVASSKNVGDFLNKQEYRASVRNQINDSIVEIKKLKKSLEDNKVDVEKILSEMNSQKDILLSKKNEQRNLLSQTNGQESEYQNMISSNYAAIDQTRALMRAFASRGGGTSNTSSGQRFIDGGLLADYGSDVILNGWDNSNCPMGGTVDGVWYDFASTQGSNGNGGDGHGYGCRQCASYVAWKIRSITGAYPSSFNAQDFSDGTPVDAPVAGSVGVLDLGTFGHVAWVESDPYINDLGKLVIRISQYNYNYGAGWGMYSITEVAPNYFNRYYKI